VYDGANPYADFDGSGALTYRYLYGQALDELFARVDAAGSNTVWHLSDRQGSVRQLVSTDGTVLDAITYDSYGNILNETDPGNGDRFKYTGREYDPILGMYYYRARYYAPGIGSFTSEDPLGFVGGDTNPYRYVHNRPTNAIDPTGRDDELVPAGPAPVARTDTGAIGAIGVAPPAGSSLGGTLGSCLGGAAGGAVTGAGTGAVLGGLGIVTLVPGVIGGTIGGALFGCAGAIFWAPPTTTLGDGIVEGVAPGLVAGVPGGVIGAFAADALAGSAPPGPAVPPGPIAPRIIPIHVGASRATVTVSGDTATVVTDYVHTLTDRRFLAAITDAARSQGATRMVVNTGAVHDIDLAIRLGEAAQTGRTIAGGTVTVTSPLGTTQPSFRIAWDTIPEVTP
jgi:RHS repeat-associated protein